MYYQTQRKHKELLKLLYQSVFIISQNSRSMGSNCSTFGFLAGFNDFEHLFLDEGQCVLSFWIIVKVENIVRCHQDEYCCCKITTLQDEFSFYNKEELIIEIIFLSCKANNVGLLVGGVNGFRRWSSMLHVLKTVYVSTLT